MRIKGHAEKFKDYATKHAKGETHPVLTLEDLAAAITALQIWDRLLERMTFLYYKENPTEEERAEYRALMKIKEGKEE